MWKFYYLLSSQCHLDYPVSQGSKAQTRSPLFTCSQASDGSTISATSEIVKGLPFHNQIDHSQRQRITKLTRCLEVVQSQCFGDKMRKKGHRKCDSSSPHFGPLSAFSSSASACQPQRRTPPTTNELDAPKSAPNASNQLTMKQENPRSHYSRS
jgi:hypothetical protein